MRTVRYTLAELMLAPDDEILGRLAKHYSDMGFASLWGRAIRAWASQLPLMKSAIGELIASCESAIHWSILLEYMIPLRDRRPDVVILATNRIFVIEFKVGSEEFASGDLWQVQSYSLDLRDFHPGCAGRTIVSVLVATHEEGTQFSEKSLHNQLRGSCFPVQRTNSNTLGKCLCHLITSNAEDASRPIDAEKWANAVYSPTPTIIEAAQTLFAGHKVQDISHAFSDSLEKTTKVIVAAIEESRRNRIRTICFVTGIPGSGKTLVGLNAVHSPSFLNDGGSSAIFLSGNGPLVKVIRESLAREQVTRGIRRNEAREVASSFIANVHGFLKSYGINATDQAPVQHAIIFDEAQRAWSADAVMSEHGINRSEPAMVMDIMSRVEGWAVIVALVGGGQEINTGEGGLSEWGRALTGFAGKWRVLASNEALMGGASVAGNRLFAREVPVGLEVVDIPDLHLKVNVRSHRAEFIGDWVNALVSDSSPRSFVTAPSDEFPTMLTRDLSTARRWLSERSESRSQRIGLLASSGAIRLRASGLELSTAFRKGVSYADWFLNPNGDIRSSYQLEIAASEFECQGLEIDWAGICWGGDFTWRPDAGIWDCFKFSGNRWLNVRDSIRRQYIVNKYRVLLTRARRGMVIWVPEGVSAATSSRALDSTAERLVQAGITPII